MAQSTYILASGVETHPIDDDELDAFTEHAKAVNVFPLPLEKIIDGLEEDLTTAQISVVGHHLEILFNEAHSRASDRELQAFVALSLLKNDPGSRIGHIREEVILEDDRSVFEHLGLVAASDLL